MDILFPPETKDSKCSSNETMNFVGDSYALKRGGKLFGEAINLGQNETTGDLKLFEEVLKANIMARSDIQQLYHGEVDLQFQHRLWRYGPDFDASKGGKWHKDTCPFGINGALPKDAIMFTLVFILYTENLNLPSAGTRVKDMNGEVSQLPCEPGKGNLIRSGEDDQHTFYHAGPLQIKKADPSKPAYRVMMQTKTLVLPKKGRRHSFARKGNWRGLKIPPLGEAQDVAQKKAKISEWLAAVSLKA